MCGKIGKGIPARSPSLVNSVPKLLADIGPPRSFIPFRFKPRSHNGLGQLSRARCFFLATGFAARPNQSTQHKRPHPGVSIVEHVAGVDDFEMAEAASR